MKKLTFKDIGLIAASLIFAIQIGGCSGGATGGCSADTLKKVQKT